MENTKSPVDPDREIAKLDYELYKEEVATRLRTLADFALSIWRGLMIVNGGAIVALFTFIGNVRPDVDQGHLNVAFGFFVVGIVAALASNLTGYFTQAAYMQAAISSAWNAEEAIHGRPGRWDAERKSEQRSGTFWELIAVAAAALSLVSFVFGSWFALSAVDTPSADPSITPAAAATS